MIFSDLSDETYLSKVLKVLPCLFWDRNLIRKGCGRNVIKRNGQLPAGFEFLIGSTVVVQRLLKSS